MRINKKMLVIGSVIGATSPIALAASCQGGHEDQIPNYIESTFEQKIVNMVFGISSGPDVNDHSFNEAAKNAISSITSDPNKFLIAKSENTDDMLEQYKNAITKVADTIVGVGWLHQKPLSIVTEHHPEIAFVFVDGELKAKNKDGNMVNQGNVASIVFKTEEAGFIAGYEAASYASGLTDVSKHKIATFGGENFSSVRTYMNGFAKGMEVWNSSQTDNDKKIALVGTENPYIGSFDKLADGKVAAKTQELIKMGASVILPVGGEQEFTVLDEIYKINHDPAANPIRVIGVDSNMALFLPKEEVDKKPFIMGSAVKNITKSIGSVVGHIHGETTEKTLPGASPNLVGKGVLGKTYKGSFDNGWVGYIKDEEPLTTLPILIPDKIIPDNPIFK